LRALLLSLVLLCGMGSIAHGGSNGPVCKSNPCTLNEPGGWADKWFAKVDAYAAKGIKFRTIPSKATNFYPQFNAWMRGQRSFPTGYCTSACAMTVAKLANEGRITVHPDTWLCFCHTGTNHIWALMATADEYNGAWFSALLTGKPFKLKDVQ
jgi:hypothetical protein